MGENYINGKWCRGSSEELISINPADGKVIWKGYSSTDKNIDDAFWAARSAFKKWSTASYHTRKSYIRRFSELLKENCYELALAISMEVGKPLWESKTEVDSMIGKAELSIRSFEERCKKNVTNVTGGRSVVRFKPHGVIAVFGPFNFPGHLPNGQIIPALIAGNTIVFKPSENTPLVAEKTVKLWEKAGLPAGVINLVQGEKETGKMIAGHPEIDGLFFTGSSKTGQAIHRMFGGRPDKILTLEMGGNNPLIYHKTKDVKASVLYTIQSAFITSGQRCTCARRLFVPYGDDGDRFIDELVKTSSKIRTGFYNDADQPFMGPVISDNAADNILNVQAHLIEEKGKLLLKCEKSVRSRALISPGIIDVTELNEHADEEDFGPLLKVFRYKKFQDAIHRANNTKYGLSAGLLSDDESLFHTFYSQIKAGIVNWNRPITGAVGSAPFGGVGASGNHRPGAYFTADFCSYPVASIESESVVIPKTIPPGIVL